MSFACDLSGGLKGSKAPIFDSLGSMLHTEQYERRTLLNENLYFLGCTKYEEYPVAVLQTQEFCAYLEGRIYESRPRITDRIAQLAERVFRPQVDARETVGKWLLGTDGDFVVFMLHKASGDVAIVNDVLGRLPLYYYQADGRLFVSRELRFVSDLAHRRTFDRMAIAQYLLFGHPLGRRTLLENVNRLPPASLIHISTEKQQVEIHRLHDWNLEEKRHRRVSVAKNAGQLVSLFSEACSNRTESINKSVVSLSGGLDSRSVAACLSENRMPFSAATFLDSAGTAERDARIAGLLTHALEADWRLFRLRPPKGRDLLRLLKTKGGLNSLEMSFLLPFFDGIIDVYGPRVTYFTGDGGDKLVGSMLPVWELKSLDDFVNWIVTRRRGRIFTLDMVSALTGVPSGDIVDEIGERIGSYSETDWFMKCVHYRIFELGPRWNYEGEDRNRFFFWSTTPFYSVQFLEYAINCPEEQKAKHALYYEFLSQLSRRASGVPDEIGKLVTGKRARLPGYAAVSGLVRSGRLGMLGRMLQSHRRSRVTGLVGRLPLPNANSALLDCLAAQIETCEPVRNYLSRSGVLAIIGDDSKRHGRDLGSLFTIASAIEAFECGTSTIERYSESDFV